MPERYEGVVVEWRPHMDFGRIAMPNGHVIGFTRAHLDAPTTALHVGDRVTCIVTFSTWGWVAKAVRPVSATDGAP